MGHGYQQHTHNMGLSHMTWTQHQMMRAGHQLQTVRCGRRRGDIPTGAVIQRTSPGREQRLPQICQHEPPDECQVHRTTTTVRFNKQARSKFFCFFSPRREVHWRLGCWVQVRGRPGSGPETVTPGWRNNLEVVTYSSWYTAFRTVENKHEWIIWVVLAPLSLRVLEVKA